MVGHIRADENSLAIRHLSPPLFQRVQLELVKLWNAFKISDI
jgi:hypothetical protein